MPKGLTGLFYNFLLCHDKEIEISSNIRHIALPFLLYQGGLQSPIVFSSQTLLHAFI